MCFVCLYCLVRLKKFVLAGASTQHESAKQGKVFMRQLSFHQIKPFMFLLEGSTLGGSDFHVITASVQTMNQDLFSLKRTEWVYPTVQLHASDTGGLWEKHFLGWSRRLVFPVRVKVS